MPFTTTADWPSIEMGDLVRASVINDKFKWLQGNYYPHNAGNLTTNTYDIGTSTYKWRNAYFSGYVEIGGYQLGETWFKQKTPWGWANFEITAGSLVLIDGLNFSTSSYITIGTYEIKSQSTNKISVDITAKNSTSFVGGWVDDIFFTDGAYWIRVKFANMSGTAVDPEAFYITQYGML